MSGTGSYIILYGATTTVGAALVALILVWIEKYRNGFGWASDPALEFNWHPFLMVLGLVFLYSQSILIYRTGRYATSKKNLKYAHAFIHLVAFVCAVIGLQAVFDSQNRQSRINLYSVHSWIGLSTVIIFAAQFLCGFIAFLWPGVSVPFRIHLLPLHVSFGNLCFIMAIIATVTGITETAAWTADYSSLPPVAYVMNFIAVIAVLYGGLTIFLILKPEYRRIPLADD